MPSLSTTGMPTSCTIVASERFLLYLQWSRLVTASGGGVSVSDSYSLGVKIGREGRLDN